MSENGEVLKFSLKRKEIALELEDKDGALGHYVLRELDGEGRDKYLNVMSSKAKEGPDGKQTGVKNYMGLCSDLLSMSLFDAQGQLVSPKTIQAWPTSVQTKLFKMALELSSLSPEKAEEEAKND